jgi:hypothetical protein
MLQQAGGEWTDEVEAQAKITMICETCFRTVERVNGSGS